jgi:hypothetical protein
MKASTPSLILFFAASFFAILFKVVECNYLVLFAKSITIPSLFIYYLVSNNYRVALTKALVFLLCFMRDVFILLNSKESAMGSFLCILFVYLILLVLSIKDFGGLKYNYKDTTSIVILVLLLGTICYSVLNLKFERLALSFPLYVVFGVVLCLLSVVVLSNYIKNESYVFVNSMMMCVCFIITDIFFVVYNFYLNLYIFSLISIVTQVLSYFFMVKYFIAKDLIKANLDNNTNEELTL